MGRIVGTHSGFPLQVFDRGGNGPPLRGGTRGGGPSPKGGGIARDAVTTCKFN